MLKMIHELRAGKALLNLVKDPNRTEEIFKIAEIGLTHGGPALFGPVLERAMSHDGFRALYERRYTAPKCDLDELERLGPDTLGGAYAAHMKKNGLSPEFFPRFAIEEPIRFLSIRARESHDIWHVLAGYDTSVKGELALQGLTLAQTSSALPGMLLSAGLLHIAKNEPARVNEVFGAMAEGYERGRKARFLLEIPFEELWDMPLTAARELAGLAAPEPTEAY